MRMDGHMMKLTVAFANLAKEPNTEDTYFVNTLAVQCARGRDEQT